MVPVEEVPVVDSPSAPLTMGAAWRRFRDHIHATQDRPMPAGSVERRIQAQGNEILLAAAREALQAQADRHGPQCPGCGAKLINVERAERTLDTQWGKVTIRRAYGRCPQCGRYVAPADVAMGLAPSEQTSPDLAEKLSWLATQMPPARAAEVFEHLTGRPMSVSRVERQAKKKGQEALAEREDDCERALSVTERFEFSKENKPADEPEEFTLVLVPDAWMLRERDDWGRTEEMRSRGETPRRWHEVKSARLFRLDHRAASASERSMLLQSTCVATREDPESFGKLLWTEAMRMGMARAARVLVVADGGVWIWNMARDRLPWAEGTLDFYHAGQHLWTVAHALFPDDEDRARKWVEPMLHQLRHGEHGDVVKRLEGLSREHAQSQFADVLEREWNYFRSHEDHLDYSSKAERGEPIGSGAVESLCKQYQGRFKLSGQFWLTENAEALLELDNRRRNRRWNSLWLHLSYSEN